MSSNVLRAFSNIAAFRNNDLSSYSSTYEIRINAVGEQLEYFIKDAFANSFAVVGQDRKHNAHQNVFSYLGTQNNPPDMMVNGGDAFEVKKIQGMYNSLALNNSPPKDRLYRSDPRITRHCRDVESGWSEKDLFYIVGCVQKKRIKHLFFVHGKCYAAEKSVYESVEAPLKREITSMITTRGLEGGKTIELGKVKRVDPLHITDLRVRGMWSIANPLKVYSYAYEFDPHKQFSMVALMEKTRYLQYPYDDRNAIENSPLVKIRDALIRDPNNPARNVEAKMLTAWW
jgi:hypothetical protein